MTESVDKKRTKIDDIKAQYKTDHKKIKDTLINHYDDEIKKLKDEIETLKQTISNQNSTIEELSSVKKQNTDTNKEIEKYKLIVTE